jgi:hypothetical protein
VGPGFCEEVDPDPNPDFFRAKMQNNILAKKFPTTVFYGLKDPGEL